MTEAAAAARVRHVTPPAERVSFGMKAAFGLGTTAESIVQIVVGGSALFFYNQVLGMRADLASLALTASLILDGMADPIIGSLSDRTKGKLGRRHPYMYAAPFFSCLSLALVFNPPEILKDLVTPVHHMAELWLFGWFTMFIVTLRVSMAFFHVPHLAMGGELSSDYVERSRVMSYSSFFGWLGGAPIRFLALSFFFAATPEHKNGLYNPDAYGPYAITAAVIAFICLMSSAHFTRSRIPQLPKAAENLPKFSPFEFFGDMGKAFKNVNYVYLLVAYFFLSLMSGLRGALDLYVNTHFWKLGPEQLRWFIIGSAIGYFFALNLAPRLHGMFDKKPTILFTSIMFAVIPAMPVLLHFAGLFPAPGTEWVLWALIANGVLGYGFTAILSISVMSALADIADENELKYGVRQEGVLYATRTFFAKVDAAIGTLMAGFALQFIHFPERAKPGTVDQEILNSLAIIESPIAMIPGLIAACFYAQFRITRQSHTETREALVVRRKERAAAALDPATLETPAPSTG